MPVEFNPDFVARMIPQVEWAALVEAADIVRSPPCPCRPLGLGGVGLLAAFFAPGQGVGYPEII